MSTVVVVLLEVWSIKYNNNKVAQIMLIMLIHKLVFNNNLMIEKIIKQNTIILMQWKRNRKI